MLVSSNDAETSNWDQEELSDHHREQAELLGDFGVEKLKTVSLSTEKNSR
jgi:hypothetical protein